MHIQSKQLTTPGVDGAHAVMLQVTGEVDPNNRIVQMARGLIQAKGTAQGLACFDEAVARDLLRSDR